MIQSGDVERVTVGSKLKSKNDRNHTISMCCRVVYVHTAQLKKYEWMCVEKIRMEEEKKTIRHWNKKTET